MAKKSIDEKIVEYDDPEYDFAKHGSPVSRNQVIHDERQIRSPDELEVGKKYKAMNDSLGLVGIFEVLAIDEPWKDFFTIMQSYGKEYARMSDFGLLPGRKGLWFAPNYVLPIEE